MRLGVSAAFVDGHLVDGDVEIVDGLVERVGLEAGRGGVALPGFVDVHTHGFGGIDFATATAEQMGEASLALAATGVTAFHPTLMTLAPDDLVAAIGVHANATLSGARNLGTHLEGPFLSKAYPGAHDADLLVNPDPHLLDGLMAAGRISQMTLAPELAGADQLIARLVAADVVVSLGHSDATAEESHHAFDLGATAVTHIFNASRPFRHRDPGLVGSALSRDDVYVTAVVDNLHLSPETALIVFRSCRQRFVSITDAMAAAGWGDGTYQLGNREVKVVDGVAKLADGTIASSVLTMDRALRNLVDLGVGLVESVTSVSAAPAMMSGRPDLATLHPGTSADIAVVDDDLRVIRTLVGGREIFAV